MNPIFVGNMFQNIKCEYLTNVVKIHVTIHRKTNVNKDDLICILYSRIQKTPFGSEDVKSLRSFYVIYVQKP